MSFDVEEQYDKIYRYCYFKMKNREIAEDITQEAFLRYFEHYHCLSKTASLKCLYTIARNLCTDEFRKTSFEFCKEETADFSMEEHVITSISVKNVLSRLSHDEQELLLLRYVNEVPIEAISKIYSISRFAVYRRLKSVSNS